MVRGTALYDAMYEGVDIVKQQTGRRAVIVFTDGYDSYSYYHTLNEIVEYARVQNVPIYPIGFGGADNITLSYVANMTER